MKALLNSAVLVLDLVSSEGTIDARHKDIVAQAHECCEELHAIVLCPEPLDSLGGELGRIGVSSVIPIICPEAALTTSALLPSLESAYRSLDLPGAPIFFATRFLDRECAASLAVILGGCAIAEAVEIHVEEDRLRATTDALGGSWRGEVLATAAPACVCLRSRGLVPEEVEGQCKVAEPIVLSLSDKTTRVHERAYQSGDGRPKVTEAQVVVVGGRGAGQDWSLVEDLADALGAGIGATRDAVDEGWAKRSAQIGQTGVTIAPKLYISLGVSGAIHHTIGMMSSGTIVAVCDDPDAPIFEIADFGVVGDLYEIVPQALEHIRAWRANEPQDN